MASGVDAAEMERRAQHMRQQRELLVAQKKAARGEKVQVEEERRAKKLAADQEVGAFITCEIEVFVVGAFLLLRYLLYYIRPSK